MVTSLWRLGLVLALAILRAPTCLSEYVWDGEEWQWQDVPVTQDSLPSIEGSGGANRDRYPIDTEVDCEGEECEGSAEGPQDVPMYAKVDSDSVSYHNTGEINVDDTEIDPYETDIGFHEDREGRPPGSKTPSPGPGDPVDPLPTTQSPAKPSDEPHKHPQGETNFFAQPGILAAVVGGTVVGLLCTILLVMLIVYRMRKADEGSYSLNEPKRSPNVHSYLKAPTREFFA